MNNQQGNYTMILIPFNLREERRCFLLLAFRHFFNLAVATTDFFRELHDQPGKDQAQNSNAPNSELRVLASPFQEL